MGSPVPRRVVAFGDEVGLPRLLARLAPDQIVAAVRASIRPGQADILEELTSSYGVPLLVQPRRDSADYPAFSRQIRDLAPDLILVDSYSMILGDDLLKLPSAGAINLHGGILPRFRGANPTQWALLADERETGVTAHYMTAEVDAGDIVAERRVPIGFRDTWRDLFDRIAEATERLLDDELPRILAGENNRTPQDPTLARHHRRRTPADSAIDWDLSVLAIYNTVRALIPPMPAAFYVTDDATHALERVHSPSEIAALKFGAAGGRRLADRDVELLPIPEPDVWDRIRLELANGPAAVSVETNWDTRRGRVVAEGQPGPLALEIAHGFAVDELGLEVVR